MSFSHKSLSSINGGWRYEAVLVVKELGYDDINFTLEKWLPNKDEPVVCTLYRNTEQTQGKITVSGFNNRGEFLAQLREAIEIGKILGHV